MSDEPLDLTQSFTIGAANHTLNSSIFANDVRNSRLFTTMPSDSSFRIRPQDTVAPLPATEPSKPKSDIALFKGQLLLKLLEIESTRCNSKEDEEERTNSLAMILEGDESILNRIHSGMSRYMDLLGIEEAPPESIELLKRPVSSGGANQAILNVEETRFWNNLTFALGQVGVTRERLGSVTPIETTIGDEPNRLGQQVDMKFRIVW